VGVEVLASHALDSLSSLMGEVESDSACRPGLAKRIRDNVMEQSKAYVARGGRAARGGAVTREPTFSPACPQAGGGVPSSVSGETRGFYEYYGTQRPLKVVTNQVDWPEEAATASTLDLLSADRRRQYSSPEGLLADEADWGPKVEPVNTVPSTAEYRRLVERLYSLKMVRFLPEVEAVNGLFCVEKDGDLRRLIVDCRPSNRKFRPPDKIELPGPDAFAQLQTKDSEGVYVSKYDVRSAFYRLQAPEWMVPFLAIPRVPGAWFGLDTEWVFPCFTVLPMGHSHSALLCQEAHAEVLRRAGFGDEQRISLGGGRWVGSVPRFFVYLDDGGALCTSKEAADDFFVRAVAALRAAGLSVKESKSTPPTLAPVVVLGFVFDGGACTFFPQPDKLVSLVDDTLALISSNSCTGGALESIVGRFSWCFLGSRLAFSVFNRVYVDIRRGGVVSREARKELWTAVGLAPLLCASWNGALPDVVVSSDASEFGLGVTATRLQNPGVAMDFWTRWRVFPSQEWFDVQTELIPNARWGIIIASRVKKKARIEALEAHAALLSLRWLVSRKHRAKTAVLLIDSTVVVGALAKGRTSAFHVLVVVRKIAAIAIGLGMRLIVVWIPSELNSADYPSRHPGVFSVDEASGKRLRT
jgi:hypothetical protein